MKKLIFSHIKDLRDSELTYREIAEILNSFPGVIYRIYHSEKDEKQGNKTRLHSRKIVPIYEILPDIYSVAEAAAHHYAGSDIEFEIMKDAILDWAYHRTQSQFGEIKKRGKKYLIQRIYSFARHFSEHQNRIKIIQRRKQWKNV